MADGGATVRQTFGAHPAAMAAVLRTALWAVEWTTAPVSTAGERCHLGSVAGSGAGGAFRAGPVRHQTGKLVALGNSDSHRDLGFEPTGVSGSRQCGPLWRESGGEFHLEPDLHGHSQRLDRRRGGVEQRRIWRAGGHTPGGGATAFALLGFDSDNGGEFLNHHLWSYMRERKAAVEFTRSRPYHSDDNAHVEQKNWTWARQLLGYGRLEDPELVGPISALYREVWAPWQNFFLPCLKLEQKWRQGSHWHKRYEVPRTAYDRLCAPGMLALKQRRQLRERYASLDPFALKDELEKKLKQILHSKPG